VFTKTDALTQHENKNHRIKITTIVMAASRPIVAADVSPWIFSDSPAVLIRHIHELTLAATKRRSVTSLLVFNDSDREGAVPPAPVIMSQLLLHSSFESSSAYVGTEFPPKADPPTAEQSYRCRKDKLVLRTKPLTLSLTIFRLTAS